MVVACHICGCNAFIWLADCGCRFPLGLDCRFNSEETRRVLAMSSSPVPKITKRGKKCTFCDKSSGNIVGIYCTRFALYVDNKDAEKCEFFKDKIFDHELR